MPSKRVFTLCTIIDGSKILLGRKKKGLGKGKWNGFGGKVEKGETIRETAVREVKEECGLLVKNLKKAGVLDFKFENIREIFQVHFFWTSDFSGKLKESQEMKPKWFDIEDVPYEKMWPTDKHWLPVLLKGGKFRGRFLFDKNEVILKDELIET